jgi:hypothetical protein
MIQFHLIWGGYVVVMFTVFCFSGSGFLRNFILCWFYVLRTFFIGFIGSVSLLIIVTLHGSLYLVSKFSLHICIFLVSLFSLFGLNISFCPISYTFDIIISDYVLKSFTIISDVLNFNYWFCCLWVLLLWLWMMDSVGIYTVIHVLWWFLRLLEIWNFISTSLPSVTSHRRPCLDIVWCPVMETPSF